MKKILWIMVLNFLLNGTANAKCYNDALGRTFCPPPGGGLEVDVLGTPLCGLGQCIKDGLGRIYCSSTPHGYATINALQSAKCTGSCVRGDKDLCQRM